MINLLSILDKVKKYNERIPRSSCILAIGINSDDFKIQFWPNYPPRGHGVPYIPSVCPNCCSLSSKSIITL